MTMTWAVCSAAPPSPRSPPSPWAPRPRSARWLSMCRQGGIFCKKPVQTTNTCTIPYFPVQYNIQYSCTGLGRKSEIKIKKTVPKRLFFHFLQNIDPSVLAVSLSLTEPSNIHGTHNRVSVGSPSGGVRDIKQIGHIR